MKSIKKSLLYMFLLMVMLLAIPTQASAAVKISKKSVTLIKGQTTTLKITGTKNKVTWSSSKKNVATVSTKGKITAKAKGAATVTAKISGKKYTCKVTVENPSISKTKLTIKEGQSASLKVSGTKQKISWKSSNKKVATVTSKGVVKGIKKGSCKITATVLGKKYVCTVTVNPVSIPVTSFSLSRIALTIKEGETEQIGTSIYPSNATNKTVKWESSNKSVATVDFNGKVNGISIGNAIISATCNGITETCEVEVIKNFNAQEAESKLIYQSYKTEDGIVIVAKNNYKYPIKLGADCIYYNGNSMIGKGSDDCYLLEVGRECAIFCENPHDSSYNDVNYTDYKINFSIEDTSTIGNASGIECTGNFGAENVMVSVTNKGQTVSTTKIAILFFKSGQVIGYDYEYANVDNVGQTDYLEIGFPRDKEYNKIYPDNFKIYVNSSYRYSWE